MPTGDTKIGTVAGLAVRTAIRGDMHEIAEATATVNGGLDGDLQSQPDRGVTLLSLGQWDDVQRQLGASLPWHTRRANVAIDGGALGGLIGRRVRIGEVVLKIADETRPCELMDRLHPGLKLALTPECRGGIHGQVLEAGRIKIGDAVEVLETA